MKTVSEDGDTITIQFTREEVADIRSAVNYVATLFEHLDREALDGWRMTLDDANSIADNLTNLTTRRHFRANSASDI